jgi:hypothetical protein
MRGHGAYRNRLDFHFRHAGPYRNRRPSLANGVPTLFSARAYAALHNHQ